ncbi:glutathione S-transferase C-terminal domain-containing protein [Paraburkholderia sediminicola]|uniref:glutathione S-transferase C-terminal domain-containing protein n=1 Tax=Paraburkholderia sediminicola TaxID=458836 RepID=UPI0038B9E339
MEQLLTGRDWLVGDEVTYADFRVACVLPFAELAGLPLADFSRASKPGMRGSWRSPPGGIHLQGSMRLAAPAQGGSEITLGGVRLESEASNRGRNLLRRACVLALRRAFPHVDSVVNGAESSSALERKSFRTGEVFDLL